ncbi:MAG: hypothetical protein LCH76_01395 [Actinobacteria bacterium]|nr:hypothetical protein [Actinomycetota bacterium]
MNGSRRLINLIGTLLVLIALVAGTILTALPIYFESIEINGQEHRVAASNQLLQNQITTLQAQEAEIPQIEQELADLHSQLPRIPQLDDVSQLVINAARKTDAAINRVEFSEVEPFVARDDAAVLDQLPQTATGVSAPADDPNGSEAAANDAVTDSTEPEDGASPEESTTPKADESPAAPRTLETADEWQFPVTIEVAVSTQVAASRFLDELRVGPRLLRIDTVTSKMDDDGKVELTINGFVFISRNN